MKRECGECTACCTHLSVHSLNKVAGQRCRFQSSGCSVYKTKPDECNSFKCLWLSGLFGEDHRPDKLGAIVYCVDVLIDRVVMVNLVRDDSKNSVLELLRFVDGPRVIIKADSVSAEVRIPANYGESKTKMLTVALEIYNS